MFKRIAAVALAALWVAVPAAAQDADQARWFLSSTEDSTTLYRDTIHTFYFTSGNLLVSDPLDVRTCDEVAIRFNPTDNESSDDTPDLGGTAAIFSCAERGTSIDSCQNIGTLSYENADIFISGISLAPADLFREMERYKPIGVPGGFLRVDPMTGDVLENSDVQVRCRRNLGITQLNPFSVLSGWRYWTVDFQDQVDVAIAGHPWTETLIGAASGYSLTQAYPRTTKPFMDEGVGSITAGTVDGTGVSYAYSPRLKGNSSDEQWYGSPKREIFWATVGFGNAALTGNTYYAGLIKAGNAFINADGSLDDNDGGDGDPTAQTIGFHFATDGKIYAAYADTVVLYAPEDTGVTFTSQELFALRIEKTMKRVGTVNLALLDNESRIDWYINDRLVFSLNNRTQGSSFYQTADMVPGFAHVKVTGTARAMLIGEIGYTVKLVPSGRDAPIY